MEPVVQHIQALSGSDKDWPALLSYLKQNEQVIEAAAGQIDQALGHLDPCTHSLGFLFMLHIKAKLPLDPQSMQLFLLVTQSFLLNSSGPQIRMLPEQLATVSRRFAEACRDLNQPALAVRPLLVAVQRGRPSDEHLTAMHADFLQMCLLARNFKAALMVLDTDVLKLSKDSCKPKDFLLYFYYGGMIYTGLKQYQRALDMFMLCFTMPCHVVSQIMVETYKKSILVSLLVHGQVTPLPKYAASWLQRHLKSASSQYHEFATAYETKNVDDLTTCVTKHKAIFEQDENFGLAEQVVHSLSRRNIQRLTATYGTMSLSDIAEQVKLADARDVERQILSMCLSRCHVERDIILPTIEQNEIRAQINQKDGMVVFLEDQDTHEDSSVRQKLEAQLSEAIALNAKLRTVDEAVAADPNFLSKVTQQERNTRWGGGAAGDSMDLIAPAEKPPGFFAGSHPV